MQAGSCRLRRYPSLIRLSFSHCGGVIRHHQLSRATSRRLSAVPGSSRTCSSAREPAPDAARLTRKWAQALVFVTPVQAIFGENMTATSVRRMFFQRPPNQGTSPAVWFEPPTAASRAACGFTMEPATPATGDIRPADRRNRRAKFCQRRKSISWRRLRRHTLTSNLPRS